MGSGTVGDSVDDEINWRGRCKWTENSRVYARRPSRKSQSNKNDADEEPRTSKMTSDCSLQEHVESLHTEKVDSCNDRLQEQSVNSPGADDPASEQPQLLEKGLELQYSALADNNHTEDHVREANDVQTAQLGSDDSMPSIENNEGNDIPKSSPLITSETPYVSEDRPCSERVSSLLSGDNDICHGGVQPPARNNEEVVSNPPEVPSSDGPANENGVRKPLTVDKIQDRIRFSLSQSTSRNEIMEVRERLERELYQVQRLVKEVEASELQLASSYSTQTNTNLAKSGYIGAEGANLGGFGKPSPHAYADMVDKGLLVRMNSVLSGKGHFDHRPKELARVSSDVGAVFKMQQRPFSRQLSVAVMENNPTTGEYTEKEKRTPKANQFYRNTEFLLSKDRLPPESNKRLKTNSGRKYRGDARHGGFGYSYDKGMKKVFKSCSSLLQRLMKHKHGWVFNEPVNAKALGLVDYHDIIKHPMDLGTIKTRLSQNWYKSPREFAEDIRLVFFNAMTYNPKGQDVHAMAEQLSEIFEERWVVIEAEYNSYWRYPIYQGTALPNPTFMKAPPQSYLVPVTVTTPALGPIYASAPAVAPMPLYAQHSHIGRTSAPKKPKANDPYKRDMTIVEKKRLSTNLEGMPPEKYDAIIQIIRKRSSSLSHNGDQIEVDIDGVDTETLWELDRFVTNHKKNLTKYKRKAELAVQARMATRNNATMWTTPAAGTEVQVAGENAFQERAEPHDGGQRHEENGSRSSSSSSSSSDSGSSSSDSDSDTSSADGSDPGNSPKT